MSESNCFRNTFHKSDSTFSFELFDRSLKNGLTDLNDFINKSHDNWNFDKVSIIKKKEYEDFFKRFSSYML